MNYAPDQATTIAAGRDRLALPGVVVTAIGLALAGFPNGAVAALLLALTWLVASPSTIVTLGAFLVVGTGASMLTSALAVAGMALTLLLPLARSSIPTAALAATSVLALALLGSTAWLAATQSLWIASGALVLVATFIGYGIHRYVVVTIERQSVSTEVKTRG
ncbi:hypothetical protein [Salinarchaeum laminariae]|uniref:hypothetical protein n=1 Tax=Salinarchaeum laminariae TaxID=869888 RepID=UPI0020C05D8F|nr:hypothetical protein [Salinarchaeum laminariae]